MEKHINIDRRDLETLDSFVYLSVWSDLINICLSGVGIFEIFLISYFWIGVIIMIYEGDTST